MAQDAKDVVLEFLRASEQSDIEGYRKLFADDMTWTVVGGPSAVSVSGKDDVMAMLEKEIQEIEAGSMSTTTLMLVAEGDTVVAEVQGKFSQPDGDDVDGTYCMIFTVRGDQIHSFRSYIA